MDSLKAQVLDNLNILLAILVAKVTNDSKVFLILIVTLSLLLKKKFSEKCMEWTNGSYGKVFKGYLCPS